MKVLRFPHPILQKPTSLVSDIDSQVNNLVELMWQVMKEKDGVGLAANQIGVDKRVMVIDTSLREDSPVVKLALINPILVCGEGSLSFKEGCLSFPGLSLEVERFSKVYVKGLDLSGKEVEITLDGFPAIVFQHELDHLLGKTFLDRVSPIKRRMALERYKKLENR
ncbi:MAG: peptide deformylase [Aquificaceae bacterium]|nr:peptide deformylase [Aquificaceae bacterium]